MFFFHASLFLLLCTSVIASPVPTVPPSVPPVPPQGLPRRISELRPGHRIIPYTSAPRKIASEKPDKFSYVGIWYQVLAPPKDTKHLPVGPDYDKFVVLHFNIKKDATLYKLGSEPGQIDPEGSLVVTRELQCLLEGVVWYRMPSADVSTDRRLDKLITGSIGGRLKFTVHRDEHRVEMLAGPNTLPQYTLRNDLPVYVAGQDYYRVPTNDAYAVDEHDVMRIRPGGQAIDVYKRPSEPGDVVSSTDIRNVPRDEWCHFVGTWNLMPSSLYSSQNFRNQLIVRIKDRVLEFLPVEAHLQPYLDDLKTKSEEQAVPF